MDSKRRAEEDATPECEEHGNPPKKRKMDSLLLEVENRNLTRLKDLVNQGADVKLPGYFSLSVQQRFENVPALFAATLSDHDAMIDFLVGKYPHFLVKKNATTEDPGGLILPTDTDTEQLIEVLELVGAACIFHGDTSARKHGWTCWNEATKLREGNAIPKTTLPQSEWEKLALRNKREFQNTEELKKLVLQRRTHWKTQAFFISQRILKKYGCFPNRFAVYNLFKFALQNWENRRLNHSRSFAISLYLIELFGSNPFGTAKFLDELVLNPTDSHNVVHLTLTELFNILRNPTWIHVNLTKPDSILTFKTLMISLVFSCEYQVKIHDHGPNDPTKEKEISELILLILKLLMSIPKSETQNKKLKSQLATYILSYELKQTNQKPNLLLKVCTSYQGQTNDFKLIKLLLEAGANPNAVDVHRCSPLHLLANKEVESSHLWYSHTYSTRAQYFTSIVREILAGTFHEDQVNLRGQSALQCIKSAHRQYPDAQLCELLGSFLQDVRPLSCTSAKVIRRHRLPYGRLPVALQSLVFQH